MNAGKTSTLAAILAAVTLTCTTETQPPADAPTATASVARIVFVGQQEACDCTKKRIADSWATLERVLGGRKDIPVERLRIDANEAEVAPYLETRAVMVIPGAYFLDKQGGIIELLQGELSEDQVSRLLPAGP